MTFKTNELGRPAFRMRGLSSVGQGGLAGEAGAER